MEASDSSSSKGAVVAETAQKQPPPQSPESIRTRRLVILSFWAVVLFLGLPIWWKTTMIYRANLPLQAMTDWSEGKVCRPTFPLRIAVEAPGVSAQEVQHLLKTTQHALDDLNDFSAHHLRLVLADKPANVPEQSVEHSSIAEPITVKDDVALLVRMRPASTAPTPNSELHSYSPVLDVFYTPNQLPTSSSAASPLAAYIAKELQAIFAEEQASLSHFLGSTPWGSPHTKILSSELAEMLSRRSTRSFKYAPTYHLTFSLITPSSEPSDWEIEAALEEYISPLLASLSSISNFTVDTQVQLHATFSPSIPGPEFDTAKNVWTLKEEDLSGFINAAEWPLSPSIGAGPTINFILYVPAAHQIPLKVKENDGTGWLIPQWGGVQILNPTTKATPQLLTKALIEPAMQTFSNQLLSLLGLPHSPKSLSVRLSTLTRIHTASLIFSASSTLGALARLTKTLPSISIPNTVAASVDLTTQHLHRACADLREGKFNSALENARVAEAEAERAFFERSMVGQVYFPDEHKVAVYLPLLGPIAVPLVTTAIKEIKLLRAGKVV
jgi:phosphatidylinositol glycan class S